jgi:epoxyqueuosine reductase QueG
MLPPPEKNMTSNAIKSAALELGADICGIAPVDRFSSAPKGFHPRDIYSDCRSVLVFAKKLPSGSLFASSCIPYTYINQVMTEDVDRLTLALSRKLDDCAIKNVPIPSDDPSEYWEPERSHARAILSLRHAGQLAGLGVIGKNTLLLNDRLGNMMQLGALLLNVELEGDPPAVYEACKPDCRLCIRACPQSALDGSTVNQQACRPLSTFRNERGFLLKKCWECRKVCPSHEGLMNVHDSK